jgi:hypothetical protein
METKDTIAQLESAINVTTAAINITNSFLDSKSWEHKRNEMTKRAVEKCLRNQILALKKV